MTAAKCTRGLGAYNRNKIHNVRHFGRTNPNVSVWNNDGDNGHGQSGQLIYYVKKIKGSADLRRTYIGIIRAAGE